MVEKSIELWMTEKNKLLANIYDNNGKVIEFKVESNYFKGEGPLYFSENDIANYKMQLSKMLNLLNGECTLNDTESNYFIKLYFISNEIYIKGYIGDYSDHSLTFNFRVDQTIIKLLLETLEY